MLSEISLGIEYKTVFEYQADKSIEKWKKLNVITNISSFKLLIYWSKEKQGVLKPKKVYFQLA